MFGWQISGLDNVVNKKIIYLFAVIESPPFLLYNLICEWHIVIRFRTEVLHGLVSVEFFEVLCGTCRG